MCGPTCTIHPRMHVVHFGSSAYSSFRLCNRQASILTKLLNLFGVGDFSSIKQARTDFNQCACKGERLLSLYLLISLNATGAS